MDYQLLRSAFLPIAQSNQDQIELSKKQLAGVQATDTVEKNILAILKNVQKNLEVSESLKKLAREILEKAAFFSDETVHQSTKTDTLKKLLAANNFTENNKLFNLSTLQAYLDNILQ